MSAPLSTTPPAPRKKTKSNDELSSSAEDLDEFNDQNTNPRRNHAHVRSQATDFIGKYGLHLMNEQNDILEQETENPKDNPAEVLYETIDDQQVMQGATLDRLVDEIISVQQHSILYEFLLTYKSFCEPSQLLGMLASRFKELKEDTQQNKLKRMRISIAINKWLVDFRYDFSEDQQLRENMENFLIQMEVVMPEMALRLKAKLSSSAKDHEKTLSSKFPTPILPKKTLPITNVHPTEIARQLAIIEYGLYKNIKPWEYLGQAWNKKDAEQKAPHILVMITRFNRVSNWVATEILKEENFKKRIKTITWFIDVAEKCQELNNLNGLLEVVSGLNQGPVIRLKQTWAKVPEKHTMLLDSLTELVTRENNHKNLREYFNKVQPPCIPYIGMYLTDLTFVEEGNKDFITEHKLINFDKRRRCAGVIREVTRFQPYPYCLEKVPSLLKFLGKMVNYDEKKLYSLSWQHEPRKAGGTPVV